MKYKRQVTGDGVETLYSEQFQQSFHSKYGALQETDHVFLSETGVKERLLQKESTRILEVGFGTGLNFWATAQLALKQQVPIQYVALENDLLSTDLLATLNHEQFLPGIHSARADFLTWRQGLASEKSLTWQFEKILYLTLVIGDARTVPIPFWSYHAVYFDPFSPDMNPELWDWDFLARMYAVMASGGRLTTFSAKGVVRRRLQSVGFTVKKRPGPPGKREMLVAIAP